MSMRGVPWDDAPGAKIWPSKWIPDDDDNTNDQSKQKKFSVTFYF